MYTKITLTYVIHEKIASPTKNRLGRPIVLIIFDTQHINYSYIINLHLVDNGKQII